MITEFKIFENNLKDIEEIQLCKLAILKFSKKLSEFIKKNGFFRRTKFKEEDVQYGYIAEYRLSSDGRDILNFKISMKRKIEIFLFYKNQEEFLEFMTYF